MSKTALIEALETFDVARVRAILEKKPELRELTLGNGLNLLQYCCKRMTVGDAAKADRQLRLATWLVEHGFDPRVVHATTPGEDGEGDVAHVSLVWFAVAKAQNTKLARYLLRLGATPGALFAAAWWGNADIVPDLVKHGANVNEVVGATPFHMAVDVLYRGVEGKPALGRQRMALLESLLRLGADPNIAAFDGTTPLHSVLHKGYDVKVFTRLLAHGANPDVPGKDGRTVREIAARKRDKRYIDAIEASTRARSTPR
jgi:hypothetical protein